MSSQACIILYLEYTYSNLRFHLPFLKHFRSFLRRVIFHFFLQICNDYQDRAFVYVKYQAVSFHSTLILTNLQILLLFYIYPVEDQSIFVIASKQVWYSAINGVYVPYNTVKYTYVDSVRPTIRRVRRNIYCIRCHF